MRLPDFLVLSVPKTGSTSLDAILRQHPEICLPFQKETWFFEQKNFKKGAGWYAEKFWHCKKNNKIGEVTTTILLENNFHLKLKQIVPSTKFIVLLRDPVERCISHYFHNLRKGQETENFETALRQETERIHSNSREMYSVLAYVAIGEKYKKYIQDLFSVFPKKQIMFVLLEELIESQKLILKDIFTFIGTTPINLKLARTNVARMPRNKILQSTLGMPNFILNKFYTNSLTQRLSPLLMKRKSRTTRARIAKFLNEFSELGQKEFKKPKIAHITRKRLEQFFSRELRGLNKLINKPLKNYWQWYEA